MARRVRRGKQSAISTSKEIKECTFCEISRGRIECVRVFEDKTTLAFLDHRPLFPGHCLLITKQHFGTISELPQSLVEPVFRNVQLLTEAVQKAMGADGSLIAINNVVSQSVPHLHVHIIPRRKGDGLRGFMWPRHKYANTEEAEAIGERIREEIAHIQAGEA